MAGPPDMMSASEGEGEPWKRRCSQGGYLSVPNANKGEWGQKIRIFVNIIYGSPLRKHAPTRLGQKFQEGGMAHDNSHYCVIPSTRYRVEEGRNGAFEGKELQNF